MSEYFHVFVPGALVNQPGSAVLAEGQALDLTTVYPWAPTSATQLVREWFPNGMTQHGIRYLLAADAQIERDRTIELVWEMVRRSEFHERPSRMDSIFAWETLDDAKAFQARHRAHFQTLIYRVDGEARHRANMPLLSAFAGAGVSGIQDARAYWRGERGMAAELWEYLLAPPVTVLAHVP